MNKLLVSIVFFFTTTVFGQADTLVAEPPAAENFEVYAEEDDFVSRSFRENFQKDYTSEDFIYETIAPKETSKWDNFKAWLQHWLDRIFSFGGEGNATAFEIILKTLAVLVVLFVVYLIVKAIINKEGGWIFGKSSKKKIKIAEFQEEDIHNIDFKTIIEKSKSANNYRLSIRYYYLWLLKRMSDSHIIEWDIEKTNSDYLYEIQRNSLKEEFQYLSYIYDYSWYGEFTIDEALFQKAEKAFIKTINSV
ncbi:hypothetical protein [Flavobacterium suncheonense]|uniref:DUF4129 domain-containing protein n=1 Tax=Flavobacterium suncheonense GH29-5 = DSM 17707 TaxID=1121899 RepID=A0A0A2MF86_9FLAO|nr:hypothetical protein [Flavobacterium suncheonense]KGO90093.1 hypothetical protein Q764_03225 [Flavobacterium suncheonense GH29-5 = DSM 17707]